MLEKFAGSLVSEENIFSQEIAQTKPEDEIVSVPPDFEKDQIWIKNTDIIFDKNSCVVHVECEEPYTILSSNRATFNVFGYQPQEIVGSGTSILMPDAFGALHAEFLKNFVQTGHQKLIFSQVRVCCQHQKGYVFEAYKFLKLWVDEKNRVELVAMIRPVAQSDEAQLFQ